MRLKDKRVYVADDDENVLEAITTILEDEGAEVIGRPDGMKIFTSVSLGEPDCIIMDLYIMGNYDPCIPNELSVFAFHHRTINDNIHGISHFPLEIILLKGDLMVAPQGDEKVTPESK